MDPALPDLPIEIYGPPPTEGTRDAFGDLVLVPSCKDLPEYVSAYPDEKLREKQCTALREDGHYIELLGGNLMIQKLANDKNALGIFGYNYLGQNASIIKAHPVDGVMPGFDSITGGSYTLARRLYIYVKDAQLGAVPGLREFVTLLAADSTAGRMGSSR
ncbi:MAG: substrate-binding domain-containing protein [Alphaproteobacteria bacterium]